MQEKLSRENALFQKQLKKVTKTKSDKKLYDAKIRIIDKYIDNPCKVHKIKTTTTKNKHKTHRNI